MTKGPDLVRVATDFHSVAIHLLRRLRTEDQALGIGPAQLSALSVVVFGGPISLNELAKAEQVRPPTMSRIVDALVKDGLVKREVNKSNRRAVIISATDKGVKVMHEGRTRRVRQLVELLRPLDRTQVESLEKASETLSKIL